MLSRAGRKTIGGKHEPAGREFREGRNNGPHPECGNSGTVCVWSGEWLCQTVQPRPLLCVWGVWGSVGRKITVVVDAYREAPRAGRGSDQRGDLLARTGDQGTR